MIGQPGTSYVFASDLAPLGSNRTYQLWGAINGQTISLRILGPKPGVSAFTHDAGVRVRAFSITADEGGGVSQTTHLPMVEEAVKQD